MSEEDICRNLVVNLHRDVNENLRKKKLFTMGFEPMTFSFEVSYLTFYYNSPSPTKIFMLPNFIFGSSFASVYYYVMFI